MTHAAVLPSGSPDTVVATPFLHDSLIHDFTPVYPDAIQAKSAYPTPAACPT
jgi:hypothetical protein